MSRWTLLLGLLLALVAVGLACRQDSALWLLGRGTALVGVELVEASGLTLPPRAVRLQRLQLRLAGSGGLLSAEGATLHYELEGGPRLRLQLDRLELIREPAVGRKIPGSERRATALSLGNLLQTLWTQPLAEVRIARLIVDGAEPLRLDLTRDDEQLLLAADRPPHGLRASLGRLPGAESYRLDAALASEGEALVQVDGRLEPAGEGHRLAAKARLDAGLLPLFMPALDLREARGGLRLEVAQDLPDDLRAWPGVALALPAKLELRARAATAGSLRVERPELSLAGVIDWRPPELALRIEPGELWRSEALSVPGLRAGALSLVAGAPAVLSGRPATGSLRGTAAELELTFARLSAGDLVAEGRLAVSALLARLSLGPARTLGLSAELGGDALRLRYPGWWLPALVPTGTLSLADGELALEGAAASEGGRRLFEASVRHQVATGRGRAAVTTGRQVFDGKGERLGQAFPRWPLALDVLAGSSETHLVLNWRPGAAGPLLSGDFRQQLDGVSGYVRDLGFVGVSGALSGAFVAPDYLAVERGAWITARRLDVGLPVDDIELRCHGTLGSPSGGASGRGTLHIQSLRAGLFGGTVSTGEHLLLAHRPPGFLTLVLDGLQLSRLLAAVGSEAVEGSGSLSGRLPLRIEGRQITMKGGQLAALPPGGLLRYRTAAGAGSAGAAMSLVEQALGNYHYHTLNGSADYSAAGDLQLRLRLEGENPDLNDGQPIRLNLALEDNIPSLLRSLRAGRAIEERVERRVNAGR